MKNFVFLAALMLCLNGRAADLVHVEIDFARQLGAIKMNQMALGQGGLSSDVMFADRIGELRALRPRVIRLFVQEYFDLLPAPGQYNFAKLDPAVDAIVATGAEPIMCICFKPRLLFPEINQDRVEPNDYAAWQALISAVVKHYKQRGTEIHYWEIGNEPDIGEDGGSPYRFQPASYVRYYKNTCDAIMGADPEARVGGPALANVRSPILPALIDFCATSGTPLRFVSWHIYSSEPKAVRGTIDYVHQQLSGHPLLKPETFLDEWNMDLTNPPLDPRFQPCYIAETIYQMKEAGLDYSCYYHIRDWSVASGEFSPFMSPHGTAFMSRWWNRMPQFDGLFDYQNHVRPSYFSFKLLSRISGNRLAVNSDTPGVHAFAAHDSRLQMHNILLWNFSGSDYKAEITLKNLPADVRTRHVQLDAAAAGDDENVRLRPDPFRKLPKGDQRIEIQLDAFGMHYWSIE
jgi:xylan 1,4-beta-xylosidase